MSLAQILRKSWMLLKVRLFCFKFDEIPEIPEIPEILTFRFKFKAKLKFSVVEIQLFCGRQTQILKLLNQF